MGRRAKTVHSEPWGGVGGRSRCCAASLKAPHPIGIVLTPETGVSLSQFMPGSALSFSGRVCSVRRRKTRLVGGGEVMVTRRIGPAVTLRTGEVLTRGATLSARLRHLVVQSGAFMVEG